MTRFLMAFVMILGAKAHAYDTDPSAYSNLGGAGAAPAGISLGAQASVSAPAEVEADEYVITGRGFNLVGKADAASEGRVGAEDLAKRPLLRPGELAETVPGVVISQHSGDGKANQFYARGFNLDHGTDFASFVEGMPVNMRSHAHGQGYSDLNFMIPEVVDLLEYEKGPYAARVGDFGAVGAVHFSYADRLPLSLFSVTLGTDLGEAYLRTVVAASSQQGPGTLLTAAEVAHNNGPWQIPEGYEKLNVLAKYTLGHPGKSLSLIGMGYTGSWTATNQTPQRAWNRGLIDRFGTLDPTDGGGTSRYSFSVKGERKSGLGHTEGSAYVINYNLSLWSDPTLFMGDPVNGDQVEQVDGRTITGGELMHRFEYGVGGQDASTELGVQLRNDNITSLELLKTRRRSVLGVTGNHRVIETSEALYLEQKLKLAPWMKLVLGARGDFYRFKSDALADTTVAALNSGEADAAIFSPKAALTLGPWAGTELYLDYGQAFHSNDARGVTQKWADTDGDGVLDKTDPATPLVKVRGEEVGLRTTALNGLQTTLALWQLEFDSEFVFSGDAQSVDPGRPSLRQGVELANYYSPVQWLSLDADYSWSYARYTEHDPIAGDYIPGSLEDVFSGDVSIDTKGAFGSLRARYFGARPLIEDNTVRSGSSMLWYLRAGYHLTPQQQVQVDVFNLFDNQVSDVDYYYPSQLAGEPAPVKDLHTHPAEPREARVSYVAHF